MPFWSSKSKSKKKANKDRDEVPRSPVGSDVWGSSSSGTGITSGGSITTPSHHHHHHHHAHYPYLHAQHATPTPQSPATKIRLSLLSSALVDALGAPGEFKPRFSYPWISSMQHNEHFNLPPGTWTDDTSMTLCLAHSLSTFPDPEVRGAYLGGFDEISQLEAYVGWFKRGQWSPTGTCFDIGSTIRAALQIFLKHSDNPEGALIRIRNDLAGEKQFSGNGSVMRVLPIGLVYWRDEDRARLFGRRSSQATHPSVICTEVCEFWSGLVVTVMQNTVDIELESGGGDGEDGEAEGFSKLALIEHIASFPFQNMDLFQALHMPFGVPAKPEGRTEKERWFWRHHPLLKLIAETQSAATLPPLAISPSTPPATSTSSPSSHTPTTPTWQKDSKFPYAIPTDEQLPSSGYAVHTVVAALYCFFATRTFEDGALMAANLGDDADTVGAVYGGLAGVWYAGEEGRAEGVFWTKRVREWMRVLVRKDMIETVAEELIAWEGRVADEDW